MPPKETDHLLPLQSTSSIDDDNNRFFKCATINEKVYQEPVERKEQRTSMTSKLILICVLATITVLGTSIYSKLTNERERQQHQQTRAQQPMNEDDKESSNSHATLSPVALNVGPYTTIKEIQEGNQFWSFYNFYEGNDTLGSAGYNTYVNRDYAEQYDLIQTLQPSSHDKDRRPIIVMKSKPTSLGPRESIRIEGKTRFPYHSGGLFILDIDHIPAGCGQWPAFWLTDTDHWPKNGEIDIVEGINLQSIVKTALHTSSECNMYAHVPSYKMTGVWDRATGIPDTYTGIMDYNTSLPADNCYVMAPHQWMNQGCVIESTNEETIGVGLNNNNGGIFVLQWDPIVTNSIQSYVFLKSAPDDIPTNLLESIEYASWVNNKKHSNHENGDVPPMTYPDPQSWIDIKTNDTILPYAYFAIGNTTGCSEQHFHNMNVIFNLAFCGNVAGNRFLHDCGANLGIAMNAATTTTINPIQACNDYIKSQPKELDEAYWAIRGLYIYQRS